MERELARDLFAASAPVRDSSGSVIAAISIAAPTSRMSAKSISTVAPVLVDIDRLPNVLPWTGFRANLHAVAGDRNLAQRIARQIESRPGTWAAQTALAWSYLGLGDTTRALDALERATDRHETWFVWYTVADPLYDPVRRNPRFVALLTRVGLNENMFSRK